MKKRSMRTEHRKIIYGYSFLAPWLIGVLLFFAYPIYLSIRMSFSDISSYTNMEMDFVGLKHFKSAFISDVRFTPMFLQVVRDALINTPLIIIFSLFISVLLNRSVKLGGFFKQVFFLPVLLGTGFIMQQILGQSVSEQVTEVARGVLLPREMTMYLGARIAEYIQLFLDKITIVLWHSGVQIILFLAGLKGINKSLFESARCDGATDWEIFWKISLPMLSPVMLLNLVYTVVVSFNDASNPMLDYFIDIAFGKTLFEYSSAIAWIYFSFVMLVIGIIFFAMRRFMRSKYE